MEFTHERVFPVFCRRTHGLAIARICGLQANCWQLLALLRDSAHMAGSHVACPEIQESRHMAGSHVWVTKFSTRFSIVHAHTESGYVYQRYPGTGFRCGNPGARYSYTPSGAGCTKF
jgi:hypothetical protein